MALLCNRLNIIIGGKLLWCGCDGNEPRDPTLGHRWDHLTTRKIPCSTALLGDLRAFLCCKLTPLWTKFTKHSERDVKRALNSKRQRLNGAERCSVSCSEMWKIKKGRWWGLGSELGHAYIDVTWGRGHRCWWEIHSFWWRIWAFYVCSPIVKGMMIIGKYQ